LRNKNMNLSALVVGLGNPGTRYKDTRHNFGFLVADALKKALDLDPGRETGKLSGIKKSEGYSCADRISAWKCMVLKPMTYMNNSGQAVAEVLRKNQMAIERILVVHDELDLEPACVKMKMGGGLAGHKGLQSIAQSLGTREFPRVRMGIGRPQPGTDAAGYVLQKFTPGERELLPGALDLAVRGILYFLEQDFIRAQQWVNSQSQSRH